MTAGGFSQARSKLSLMDMDTTVDDAQLWLKVFPVETMGEG